MRVILVSGDSADLAVDLNSVEHVRGDQVGQSGDLSQVLVQRSQSASQSHVVEVAAFAEHDVVISTGLVHQVTSIAVDVDDFQLNTDLGLDVSVDLSDPGVIGGGLAVDGDPLNSDGLLGSGSGGLVSSCSGGVNSRCLGGGVYGSLGASHEGNEHQDSQQSCDDFLHWFFLLMIFLSKRSTVSGPL